MRPAVGAGNLMIDAFRNSAMWRTPLALKSSTRYLLYILVGRGRQYRIHVDTPYVVALFPCVSDSRIEHSGRRHTDCAGASQQVVASADDVFPIGSHRRACNTKKTGSASKNCWKKYNIGEITIEYICIFIINKNFLLSILWKKSVQNI